MQMSSYSLYILSLDEKQSDLNVINNLLSELIK